jgi:hypothetical protein
MNHIQNGSRLSPTVSGKQLNTRERTGTLVPMVVQRSHLGSFGLNPQLSTLRDADGESD